jgi:hypothetical protein
LAPVAALVTWLWYPIAISVRIEPEPFSLCRYDDLDGHLPLGAVVRITNVSDATVWFLGRREMPVLFHAQFVDGKWDSRMSYGDSVSPGSLWPKQWTALRNMESLTILAAPVSEEATEMRVGLAFTTEKLTPKVAHWVFSPVIRIVKRGQDLFPELKQGSAQQEQVLPLESPVQTWLRLPGP